MNDPQSCAPQVLGDYEVLNKIADGGMCPVYRARHQGTGLIVAIKALPSNTAKNPVLLRRFEQEFRAASKLDHPSIVRALDFCNAEGAPFLVMEYIEGISLGEKLEREGAIPEAESIRIIAQVCQGLQYVHNLGVIHRDIKPDNIILTPQGEAKLTDLGLVKELMSGLNLTRTGGGLGTPHFMAPEQFRDAKNADARCDVYGLGATLYMMVTGKLPFAGSSPVETWKRKTKNDLPTPRTLAPSLTVRTDRVIRLAMAADRNQRPASCLELKQELTGKRLRGAPRKPEAPGAPLAPSSSPPPQSEDALPPVQVALPNPVSPLPPATPAAAGTGPLTWLVPLGVALAALAAGHFLFR